MTNHTGINEGFEPIEELVRRTVDQFLDEAIKNGSFYHKKINYDIFPHEHKFTGKWKTVTISRGGDEADIEVRYCKCGIREMKKDV